MYVRSQECVCSVSGICVLGVRYRCVRSQVYVCKESGICV